MDVDFDPEAEIQAIANSLGSSENADPTTETMSHDQPAAAQNLYEFHAVALQAIEHSSTGQRAFQPSLSFIMPDEVEEI